MTTRPSEFPDWARIAQNDPISGGPNIVDPPSAQKDTGWLYKQKPPSSWFNWLLNLTSNWLRYLDGSFAAGGHNYYSAAVVTTNNYNITDANLPQPFNGMNIRVYSSTPNTGATTLSINGGTSYPIKTRISNNQTEFLEGEEIFVGGYYDLFYIASDAIWQLTPQTFTRLSNLQNGTGYLIPRPVDIKDYIAEQIGSVSGFATGMRMPWDIPTASPPAGWIPDVTGTIGNVGSGATIRANADCFPLYELWWNNLSYNPMVGIRGVSASADFAANKLMHLPTTANRSIVNASGSGKGIGATGGASTAALTEANNGQHNHDVTSYDSILSQSGDSTPCWANTRTRSTQSSGSGSSFSIIQPSYYTNIFIKL